MAAAAATTRPVVLELGGNDAAILAPDVDGRRRPGRPDRRGGLRHQRAGVHGDQAALRAPRPAGRDGGRAGRPSGRASWSATAWPTEVTMGPVHTAAARDRVEAMLAEADAAGGSRARGRAGCGPRTRVPAATSSRRRSWWRRTGEARHRPRGAVRPGPAGDPLRRHRRGGRRGERHGVRAVRLGLEQRRRAGRRRGVPPRRPGPCSSTPTESRPSTCTRRWAGGSSQASASSSGPRACRPSPASGSGCAARRPAGRGWRRDGRHPRRDRGRRHRRAHRCGPTSLIDGERVRRHRSRRRRRRAPTPSSTPPACSSHPASSTCTPTTTRSSSGTPMPARRRCTA